MVQLPSDRVILALDGDNLADLEELMPLVYGICARFKSIESVVKPPAMKLTKLIAQVTCSPAQVGQLHRDNVDVQACDLDVGQSFVACIRTDRPDELFSTVVTDASGVALGLVYSSTESIVAAIESLRGVYYSRSR